MEKLILIFGLFFSLGGCTEVYARDNSYIETLVIAEAVKQGLDPQLALAIAKTESSLNPNAIGSKGEIGVFQIMPFNAPHIALFDPKENIRVGILLLRRNKIQCADMGQYWVVCFNNGVNRRPKYPYLHPYYKRVIASLRGIHG